MRTIALFSAFVAVASALVFPPTDLPSSCAAILCEVGTVCREVTRNGVTQARCIRVKPEDPRPSCANVRCGFGQVCQLKSTPCFRPPCLPQPVCVDVKIKIGECPKPRPFEVGVCASSCSTDQDCPSRQKCCRNGCGATTCQEPAGLITQPIDPVCDSSRCQEGQKCVLQEVQCFRAPCPPITVCVGGKSGQCPKPDPFAVGICAFTCEADTDCPGQEKCCKTPCGGTSCQAPVNSGVVATPPPKPSCKTVRCGRGERCVLRAVPCFVPPCPVRPVCESLLENKPGSCPRRRYGPRFLCLRPRRQCRSDAGCPGQQKCCSSSCGVRCLDPEPGSLLSCATVRCVPDHQCVMKTVCDKQGCFPRPTCVPVKRCPFFPAFVPPGCVPEDTCPKDPFTCPPGTLCCSTNCGRHCVRPLE